MKVNFVLHGNSICFCTRTRACSGSVGPCRWLGRAGPFGPESKHVWESLKLCGSHLYEFGLELQDVVLEYMEMDKETFLYVEAGSFGTWLFQVKLQDVLFYMWVLDEVFLSDDNFGLDSGWHGRGFHYVHSSAWHISSYLEAEIDLSLTCGRMSLGVES